MPTTGLGMQQFAEGGVGGLSDPVVGGPLAPPPLGVWLQKAHSGAPHPRPEVPSWTKAICTRDVWDHCGERGEAARSPND